MPAQIRRIDTGTEMLTGILPFILSDGHNAALGFAARPHGDVATRVWQLVLFSTVLECATGGPNDESDAAANFNQDGGSYYAGHVVTGRGFPALSDLGSCEVTLPIGCDHLVFTLQDSRVEIICKRWELVTIVNEDRESALKFADAFLQRDQREI